MEDKPVVGVVQVLRRNNPKEILLHRFGCDAR
jgi:hypothetical protein